MYCMVKALDLLCLYGHETSMINKFFFCEFSKSADSCTCIPFQICNFFNQISSFIILSVSVIHLVNSELFFSFFFLKIAQENEIVTVCWYFLQHF